MKSLLNRIHARVGDLWWYSAMIFLACRSGDVIQAFIGLWLVPKYVGPQELGAVLPLQQLTSFLTVPLAIVAVVFSKYVNTYATRGEYGKVKSFIHDVFICSFILFVICIAGAYFIMPFFYERLRIASGSLTFLILLCGLVANIGAIIGSAQQGLKRFKTMSIMTFLGAPIRLVTLLIAMPIRALSGYILGQTTPGATTAALSFLDIRSALKTYTPDKTWRKDLPEIWRYLWPYALCTIIGMFWGTMTSTIYRQRLPEIESSANYLLSRFAEIAGFVGCSLNAILIPLASEAHEQNAENIRPLKQAVIGSLLSSLALAVIFYFISPFIFSLTETWSIYRQYAHLLPILTVGTGISISIIAISSYEYACRRIGAIIAVVINNGIWALFLICFTGYSYFDGILPHSVVDFMASLHIAELNHITWYGFAFGIIQFLSVFYIAWQNRKRRPIVK